MVKLLASAVAQRWMWVLWPSFLVACALSGVFFALFDPEDLLVHGQPTEASRETLYTLGFFSFWGFTTASSWLTLFLQRTSSDLNQTCPLDGDSKPDGCRH
jgi:hypothetical protein